MIYAKLDVCFWRHPRFHRAGPVASFIWTATLVYLRENDSTTGRIEEDELLRIASLFGMSESDIRQVAQRLVEVGLFDAAGSGYVLCRYAAKNETREDIESRRAATRARVEAHRAKKRSQASVITDGHVTTGNMLQSSLQPSVTRAVVPGSGFGSGSGSVSSSTNGSEGIAEPKTGKRRKKQPAPVAVVTVEVKQVFDSWARGKLRHHPKGEVVLDVGRASLIAEKLKEFPLDLLVDACEGIWCTAWNLGRNKNQTEYTDIEIAIRNAKNIEQFAENARQVRAEKAAQ